MTKETPFLHAFNSRGFIILLGAAKFCWQRTSVKHVGRLKLVTCLMFSLSETFNEAGRIYNSSDEHGQNTLLAI